MLSKEIFAEAVDEFGKYLNAHPQFVPSDYQLLEFINSDIVYGEYQDDEDVEEIDALDLETLMKAEENTAAMTKLKMIRENFYLRAMAREPKASTSAIFALKQPKNGGYSDKQEVTSEKTLTIKFAGVGEDAGK